MRLYELKELMFKYLKFYNMALKATEEVLKSEDKNEMKSMLGLFHDSVLYQIIG